MTLRVELLTESDESQYTNFLSEIKISLLYASLPYRDFLLRCLKDSEAYYFMVLEANQFVGVLPAFLKKHGAMGNILNSLPFFGSNGGLIVHPLVKDPLSVQRLLLDAFHSLAREKQAAASTIVSSPLDPKVDFYESYSNYNFRDERIGQLTPMPFHNLPSDLVCEALMNQFHKKTRNSIRKSQASGVQIRHTDQLDALKSLAEMHKISMDAIGVPAKPWFVFMAIREAFLYERDYRIYIAEMNGHVIGGLLVFFYNQIAEYYIPATVEGARVFQPMSLLIFEAMQEAVRRGCQYWNWGGTGLNATGVYNFKKRWGTEDHRYFYYTRIYDDSILKQSREAIAEAYPYYYVFPFNQVKQ
jgi:hypothetical protein